MRRFLLGLVLALVALSPAQAAWREASSDHFVIYSEESARSLEEFATKLERFDAMLRYRSRLPAENLGPANRLTVFVLPSQGAIKRLYDGRNANVAGFYIPRASGSYAFTPRRIGDGRVTEVNELIILLHEYAHHFMLQNYAGAYPAWFIEGFAEFYSTTRFDRDGSIGIGIPAHHRARNLFTGVDLPIERLLTVSGRDLRGMAGESIYGRGWLLTHYLTFSPTRSTQLLDYLRALNAGKSSLDAAKAAFGDLKQLDKELDRYLSQSRMSYQKITPDRIPIGKINVRELSPGENAIMDVRMRTKRGSRDAAELVPLARKVAASYPNDALVQVTLAEVEFDARNFAEAEAAADRALKADPKLVEGLIYKGRARMGIAARDRAADPAVWRQVRSHFAAASRLDPDDPEPKLLFFRSFIEQGAKPTANAAEALAQALVLAPQDRQLRWMVAQQHLNDGKTADARRVLAPLAYDPHGGPRAEAAAAILARLDQIGAKAALDALRAAPRGEEDGDDDDKN